MWVPEAEPVVGEFRARFCAASVARRIPPHVTLLFPFVPVHDVGRVRATLTELAASLPSFDASLTRVDRFDGHVWLAPEPRERWLVVIETTCSHFPDLPPYGGAFDVHVPHLTIGEATEGVSTEAIVEAASEEIGPRLPFRFSVRSLSLLEEQPDRTWSVTTQLPFA